MTCESLSLRTELNLRQENHIDYTIIGVDLMKFRITYDWGTGKERDVITLLWDKWDDYGYCTTFHASYYDTHGKYNELGTVKIALAGMDASGVTETRRCMDNEFEALPDGFFSLWQTAEAYKRVVECEKTYKCNILCSLNDIALMPDIYEKYKDEDVLKSSLMRGVSYSLYDRQFKRIVRGEAVLTPYNFSYIVSSDNPYMEDCKMDFTVVPNALPPTNVHAIIGSNGVGKTTLIKRMVKSICKKDNAEGRFEYLEANEENGSFENIICISFNPFDDYSDVELCGNQFKYIGIRKEYSSDGYEDGYGEISLLDDISSNYMASLRACLGDVTKKDDLKEVLKMLETDCNFLSSNYEFDLNVDEITPENLISVKRSFSQLSAGHKIVLSIITRCIDELVEKSVVLIDEPENHLHPPLLSSLVRGLSRMLIKRNGVAIVSTHSPIVLQEIPRSCVWILYREGNTVYARRPEIETFGTNIGVLTNVVFDYEVRRTGFNTLLQNAVREHGDYESVLSEFNYQLGDEAKSIVRILLKQKELQ